MASLTRVLQNLFGASHGTNEVAQFGSLAAGSPQYTDDPSLIQALTQFAEGLFSVTASASQAPRIEDFNGLLLLLFRQLKYLFQAGVPEWIATENYYAGKSLVSRNGQLYIALSGTDLAPNSNIDPAADNGENWAIFWNAINSLWPKLLPIQSTYETNKPGMMIPLYIYPTGGGIEADYANVISLAKKYSHVPIWVIINPSNGPGTVTDGNFTDAINKLHGAGVKVLGYVATDYPFTTGHGTVSEAQAQTIIDTWLSLYSGIDGIFLDEMSYASPIDPNVQAYYLALMNYGHQKGLYPIVANPGTAVDATYYSTKIADVIVIYENAGLPAESTLDTYSYNTDYPTTRRALLAYGTGAFNSASFLTDMKYVGMIFCNDGANLPNPWDYLTSTLEQQLMLLGDSGGMISAETARAEAAESAINNPTIFTDFNSITGDGVMFRTNNTPLNSPNGISQFFVGWQFYYDGNDQFRFQLAKYMGTGLLWYRGMYAGVWDTSWTKIWDSLTSFAPAPASGQTQSGLGPGTTTLNACSVGETRYAQGNISNASVYLPSGGTYQYIINYEGAATPIPGIVGESSGGTAILTSPGTVSAYNYYYTIEYRRVA